MFPKMASASFGLKARDSTPLSIFFFVLVRPLSSATSAMSLVEGASAAFRVFCERLAELDGTHGQYRDVRENGDRFSSAGSLEFVNQPGKLLLVEFPAVNRFRVGVNAVEHDEMPSAPVEAAIALADSELVERPLFAPLLFLTVRFAALLVPAPDVVVADHRFDRQRTFCFEGLLPQLPLQFCARCIDGQRVHYRIAAGDDEVWFVVERLNVVQRLSHALLRAAFGLNVNVGDVRQPQGSLRLRFLFGSGDIAAL